MIAAIRRLLADFSSGGDKALARDDELRLAVAALLFHVAGIDGVVSDDERAMLSKVLKRRFELRPGQIDALVGAAEMADAEAVDLYGFTSVLKRGLDAAEREGIVEMMWRLVFADGRVHEFEDNMVWRVAELLGVPSQTRIRLKQAAREDAG